MKSMIIKTFISSRNIVRTIKRKYCVKTYNVLMLRDKELFHDVFPDTARPEISALLTSQQQCVYAGFDPTADSLHVGNLLVLVNLLHWQHAGHQVLAVIGGATAQIGDPSGRSKERPELAEQIALDNAAGIQNNIETICRNYQEYICKDSKKLLPFNIINNLTWYRKLDLVRFIADIGRHLRVGTMLSRHSVQTRMASDAGISFTEFSYQIFQAYDWLHLFKTFNCKFQVGGNDQMGNIMSGHDLISRTENQKVYGLLLPLVTSEAGDKFGKSAGNAVWLDAKKTSPFELYQFFIRTPDSAVANLLKLYTFLSDEHLESVISEMQVHAELRNAQKLLAEQVTLLVHGENGLKLAKVATSALYEGSLDALSQLNAKETMQIFNGASYCEITYNPDMKVLDLAMEAKCFSWLHDANRIIKGSGFKINHKKVTNPENVINPAEHILSNGISLIKVGKKNYYVVKWNYS